MASPSTVAIVPAYDSSIKRGGGCHHKDIGEGGKFGVPGVCEDPKGLTGEFCHQAVLSMYRYRLELLCYLSTMGINHGQSHKHTTHKQSRSSRLE